MRRFIASHAPALAWSALVAVLLLTPGDLDTSIPGWLARFGELGGDKVIHVGLFFVQALCLGRTVRAVGVGERSGPWLAVAAAVLYGLLLEIAQRGVPGRSFEWVDLAADGVGALAWVGWEVRRPQRGRPRVRPGSVQGERPWTRPRRPARPGPPGTEPGRYLTARLPIAVPPPRGLATRGVYSGRF